MSWIRNVAFRVGRTSEVRRIRRVTGRFGAPGLNPEFEAMRSENAELSRRMDALATNVNDVGRHLPAVLNAIQSANGTSRLLRRELEEQIERLSARVERLAESLPVVDTDSIEPDR